MIPLRDTNPSRTVPFITYALIAANLMVFLYEFSLPERLLTALIFEYGVIPARLLYDVSVGDIGLLTLRPLLISMFLHGGWLHLLGNMLFLYIFGDNVEDRFGHGRFLFFYIIAGIAAALTQVVINPASEMPMVGASGAIAGVLGAYVLMFPTARVVTLIPVFIFFFPIVELPAFVFLGVWFLMQMLSGLLSLGIAADAGGVAWWAHIGGFATGAILMPFLRRRSWR
jgi:membrane associated rhomboid family serine protease